MGKKQHSKDRLFITQTEHKYLYGGKVERNKIYKRLPHNCCSLSLSPFQTPVCTREGHVFDLEALIPYLQTNHTNPVTGEPLSMKQLIKLKFHKDSDKGKGFICPVTCKEFTDNTKIAAIATSGNVYSYSAVEELNIKSKNWTDLISGEKFKRKDIIILQDPQDFSNREIEKFEHYKKSQEEKDGGETFGMSRSEKVNSIRTNPATERIMKELEKTRAAKRKQESDEKAAAQAAVTHSSSKKLKFSTFTDGNCSKSLTSTVCDPTTENKAAIASDAEVLEMRWKAVKKLKKKGYVSLHTNFGRLNIELHCDFVPRTCDNFLTLCERGYYNGVTFHRLIPGFMVQGGDPNGTGTGGDSAWGKPFDDEPDSRLNHTERGILSMANAGRNTNNSQFFFTFAPCQHLDYKHTIFGKVVGGIDTLAKIETQPTGAFNKPLNPIVIEKVEIHVNPFKEYEEAEQGADAKALEALADAKKLAQSVKKVGQTWAVYDEVVEHVKPSLPTVKGAGVGKYLNIPKNEEKKTTVKNISSKKPAKSTSKFGDFSGW